VPCLPDAETLKGVTKAKEKNPKAKYPLTCDKTSFVNICFSNHSLPIPASHVQGGKVGAPSQGVMTRVNTRQRVISLGRDCIQSSVVYTVAQGSVLLGTNTMLDTHSLPTLGSMIPLSCISCTCQLMVGKLLGAGTRPAVSNDCPRSQLHAQQDGSDLCRTPLLRKLQHYHK